MKRKLLLILLGVLFVSTYADAKERTEQEMRNIAFRQLSGKFYRRARAIDAAAIQKVSDSPLLHIYESDQGGFVVIAKDDAFKPVLGYSTSPFEKGNMPEAFDEWLKNMETSMEAALALNGTVQSADVPYTPTENFLTTTWGQGDPFNFKSPVIGGKKAPSGCVATAMSQIMYYFKYPAQGEGEGTYRKSQGSSIPMPVNGVYHWDQMKESYKSVTLTDELREPISTLLFDAAISCSMNFEDGGSGSDLFDAGFGLAHNFGYDSLSIKIYFKDYCGQEEWQKIIYSELAARRPILAAGFTDDDGHAFVFSGIDEDGLIYINWGWDGQGDGFYAIDTWSPLGYSYNQNKNIICGLNPSKEPAPGATYGSQWVADYTVSYQNIRNWIIVKADKIANYSPLCFYGNVYLCFESENGDIVKAYSVLDVQSFEPGHGYTSYSSGTIKVEDLPAGTYKAYLASKAEKELGYSIVRSTGGPIYYNITKDANGVITVSEAQSAVTGINHVVMPSGKTPRYFDLQGREVDGSTKGLIIRRHGDEVKKVIVR